MPTGIYETLLNNFKLLVEKFTYNKTEVDDKLSEKANNSLVSQSSNGLMSSTDKVKLDGIATGANKTVVDSSLSTTSTNPVQNKVIAQEILNLENAESDLDTIVNDGGGTNLLPYTKDFRDSYYDTTSTLTGETYRGLAIRKLDNTAGSEKGYQDLINIYFNAGNFNYGETFTLSFWLRGDTEGNVDNGPINTYFYGEPGYVTTSPIKSSDGFTKGFSDGQCKLGITNEWRRVYVTYKLNTTGSLTTNKRICIRVYDGYSIEVCGLKLEKGSIPSDWSPALSDLASSSHTHTSWGGIQADATSVSGDERGGYRNIMQIKINGTYTDQPITFDFTARNIARSVRVFISFASTANTDPGVTSFKYDGLLSNGNALYLVKTATSTWNLYCKEVGTYTNVAINNLFTGSQTKSRVTITFPNLRVTSLPTGTSYTASEWLANGIGDIQSALDKIIGV